jgi:SAM domain (Sterile alpha motif)
MQQIADWLEKLGLGQYAPRFAANDVNFAILTLRGAAVFVFLSSAAPCLAFTADARVQSRGVAPSGAAHQSCALSP